MPGGDVVRRTAQRKHAALAPPAARRYSGAMIRFPLLAPLALLAACHAQAPAPAPSPSESGYIAKVQALSPGLRDGVLFRAIKSGGGAPCQGVKQAEVRPPSKAGQPIWRVTCTDGSQWLVMLSDDGTALITGARDNPQPSL